MKSVLTRHLILLGVLSLAGTGCGVAQKSFTVVSYPKGASIYLDEVQVGQTDRESLLVDFRTSPFRTLRVEKPGFQTAGVILYPDSSTKVDFFLQRAPDSERILEAVAELKAKVDQLQSQILNLQRE